MNNKPLSKHKIIKEELGSSYEWYNVRDWENLIENAMSILARQEAIEFLKWFGKMGYEYVGWDNITEEPFFANANQMAESANTLYEQYIFESKTREKEK